MAEHSATMEEIKSALKYIETQLQSVKQSAVALDIDFDQLRNKFHDMDKGTAVLTSSVKAITESMATLAVAVALLKTTADRWHGIVVAALVLGPILSSIIAIMLRYVLFGHPMSSGGGGLIQ